MLIKPYFNSIKVRLEPEQLVDYLTRGVYFNSIKVRLEPSLCVEYPAIPPFQFHKGTIRTVRSMLRLRYRNISIP